jgi:hypothetical protein
MFLSEISTLLNICHYLNLKQFEASKRVCLESARLVDPHALSSLDEEASRRGLERQCPVDTLFTPTTEVLLVFFPLNDQRVALSNHPHSPKDS